MADEVIEISQQGKALPARRFDMRDWAYIATYVIDEWGRRKRNREDRERYWKEIDRQIAMTPDLAYKKLPNGKIDRDKIWMSEMELPLQAQALEVLTADARQMMFPESGPYFRAHAMTTDQYLQRADFSTIILGDENDVPSRITQDNADKLVQGYLEHLFDQYDLPMRCDRINAESFKYGMGVGRARMERKNVFIHEARGVRKETQLIPTLVPVSVKSLYLDEPMPSMHSAQVLGDAHIAEDWIRLENLILAASRGSSDPNDDDGGWMPKNVAGLEPQKNGFVQILEMEGDIVIPRKSTRSFVIPGAIATVAVGGKDSGGNVTSAVIRFRFRQMPFSSYLLFPYHYEGANDAYPTSPLMKGRTVQILAVQAVNRLLDSAALKNSPPVGYDKSNMEFAQQGGPHIHPNALWGTIDPVKVYAEIGGDPSVMLAVMTQAINLYSELTGVLPGRLGAQTVSHTTAFAKNTEIQRGAVRTVDYVNQSGHGPLTRWLDMSYRMGRASMRAGERISFFIDAYGGFVEIGQEHLPDEATFEWFGSGGPADQQQQQQARLASLNMAIQMDQLAMAQGRPPSIDIGAAQREVLRNGGWTDVDAIIRTANAAGGTPAAPGIAGPAGAAAPAALTAISGLAGS